MAWIQTPFLAPEGELDRSAGVEYVPVPSDGSDYSSSSDGGTSDSLESERGATDRRKLLNMNLAAKIKKRAEARERGATIAFHERK